MQNRTLRCGTTTAIYFGTIHCNSSVVLGEVAHCRGQRALVGKVNMDMNSPTELLEDTDISIQETERFIQDILAMKVGANLLLHIKYHSYELGFGLVVNK